MKLFITEQSEDKKCSGCNWETYTYYGVGDKFEDAQKQQEDVEGEDYGLGLCAECMLKLIYNGDYEISIPEKGGEENEHTS